MNMVKSNYLNQGERQDIIEKITSIIRTKQEIAFAFLYGSFLEEPFFRDIDIGIFVKGVEKSGYWDYECMISQQIEDTLNQPIVVEVKVINSATISFCFQVVKGETIFVRDEDFLSNFMVSIARLYLDMSVVRHTYLMEAMT